ncbi:MAG: GNAT family N-acetyltransferase [Solirubrobacterales bacterium]
MLRPPEREDLAGYVQVFQRPEVNAWLRPEPFAPITAAEAAAMLEDDLRHWRERGFGPWAVIEEGEERYLGRVGLRWTTVEGEAVIELAWTIDPDHHGRGLATTGALAGLELARELGLEEVIALALPANTASRRVAEKAGMVLEGEVEHAGLPHVLYRWRRERGLGP